MKKRLLKKTLAAFLAVMMVATSIPFSAITAFAANGYVDTATDEKVQAVETAMKNFASKLADEKSYSNVGPAYAAYVACQQGLDAYIYGGESDALDGLADKLDTAVAGMTEFTGIKANTGKYRQVQVYTADDTGFNEETYLSGGYKNVLWLETGITTDDNDGKASADSCSALTLFYPSATLLYDGDETPATSVMAVASGESSANGNKNRYISAITLENADEGIQVRNNWRGTDGNNLDFNWSWYYNGNNYNLSNNTTTAGTTYQIRKASLVSHTNYQKFFSNIFEYTGELGDRYTTSFTPTFKGRIGSTNDFATNVNDSASPTVPGSTAINVVNYKIVKDAITAAGDKMKTKDLTTYSMGGLYPYFAAMDEATTFDPNTYFTSDDNSKNDITGYAKAAGAQVQAVTNASIDGTNDKKANYQALRDAMGDKIRLTYAEGNDNNEHYTADTWATFVEAYEASQAFMAKVNDDTFTDADSVYKSNDDAKVYADALNAAYAALKTTVAKADTSELIALIQQFGSYNSTVFTEETYNAALTAVNKIKTDIWGDVENFGVPAYGPNDTEEGRALIANAIEEYNAAFAALRISPDAIVLTESGSYSLNQAIDLENNISDPTDYSNYATFATALNDAKIAKNNLATTVMTDYDAQYDAYVAVIDTLVKAYNALQYSFTKIPDGTVFGNGKTNAIDKMSILDQGGQYVEGSFTNQGYIFRTKHTPLQVKFGDFNVTFGVITSKSDAFQLLKNNALDSITINATAAKIAENGSKTHLTSKGSTSTPNALSDEQKSTYAGCLEVKDEEKGTSFSVSNLRYTGKNNYNDSPHIITLNDGTEISDYNTAITTNLDSVLGTTDGSSANPIKGGVFARSNDGSNGGETYIKGDFNFAAPATEQQTLTATSFPTATKYELGTKFGAVTAWNCRNTMNYCGYNWFSSEMNNQVLNPQIQVVDISPLVELVDLCNTYLPNSDMYTDESWATFVKALERAQSNYDYTSVDNTTKLNNMMTTLKSKYTGLWNAKEALEVKTLNVTFNYKDATGADATLVFPVTYGQKLSDDQLAEINEKIVAYVDSKNYTHDVEAFDPEFTQDATITADVTYTVKYDETGVPNAAVWTAFNEAKAALLAKLQSGSKFTVAALESVKSAIAELTYFNLTSDEQAKLKADVQDTIDSQKDTMLKLADSLTAITIDDNVADAVNQAQAEANKNDYDMYDKLGDNFNYTKDVTFDVISADLTGGEQLTVKGYLYSNQTELDTAIKAALEGLKLKEYDIYVNGEKIGTVPYGTPLSVTPTEILSTTDTTVKGDGANYSWTYSFTAPSRDPNFGTDKQDNSTYLTADKYMITAPSFGFIVKGETYLKATQVSDKANDVYTVTFKSSVNSKIINVINTEEGGNFTMPTAPSIAYYSFDSYSNGVAPGAAATVTQDTVITVNYKADEENLYTFYVYNTPDDFLNTETAEVWDTANSLGIDKAHDSVAYNELVNVSIPGSYAIAKVVYDEDTGYYLFNILAFGDSYSFYANETIGDDTQYAGIVGLTEDEYKTLQEPSNDIGQLFGTDGVRIVAEQDTLTGNYITKDLEFEVYNRETPVFAADNSKFSLIGTFIKPTGYEMVETGFLMTMGDSSLTVENAADKSKGVSRFKASKYTVGNQFVINIKTPSTAKDFRYVAYAKYKDKDGNIVTKYGKTISANTANS